MKEAVSRRYIHVCNFDVFTVVNMYLEHLKLCLVCINSRRYVCFRGEFGFLNCDDRCMCIVNKQFEL